MTTKLQKVGEYMIDLVTIRLMNPGEEQEICVLVARVFDRFIAGDFSSEGIKEFYRYVKAEAMKERRRSGNHILVAEEGSRIVGVLELKRFSHISLLFVENRGGGLGRALVERALRICSGGAPGIKEVSVHASRYALPIYRRLGFEAEGSERTENGITYVPMVFKFKGDE
jgi:GNAT superfamily N-acetyltransferase